MTTIGIDSTKGKRTEQPRAVEPPKQPAEKAPPAAKAKEPERQAGERSKMKGQEESARRTALGDKETPEKPRGAKEPSAERKQEIEREREAREKASQENPETRRQIEKHQAREGLPVTGRPDYRTHGFQFPERASLPRGETGVVRVRTNGPITVHRNSATLPGVDGNRYTVSWQPLDANGQIKRTMGTGRPDQVAGGLMRFGDDTATHQPPYHNPHGWVATVKVERNPNKPSKQALGVTHDVRGS